MSPIVCWIWFQLKPIPQLLSTPTTIKVEAEALASDTLTPGPTVKSLSLKIPTSHLKRPPPFIGQEASEMSPSPESGLSGILSEGSLSPYPSKQKKHKKEHKHKKKNKQKEHKHKHKHKEYA